MAELDDLLDQRLGVAKNQASELDQLLDNGLQQRAQTPKPLEPQPAVPVEPSAMPTPAAEVPGPSAAQRVLSASSGFFEGIPFVGHKALSGLQHTAAGIKTLVEGGEFQDHLGKMKEVTKEAQERSGGFRIAGQIAGGVTTLAPVVAAAPAAFGLRAGAGLAERAAVGGAASAAISGGDILAKTGDYELAARGAMTAGLVGAVLTPLAGKIGGAFTREAPTPTSAFLERSAQVLDEAAQATGIRIRQAAFRTLEGEMNSVVRSQAFTRGLVPEPVRRLLTAVTEVAHSPTGRFGVPIGRLELLRREAATLANNRQLDTPVQRLAQSVLERLDDFATNLGTARYPVLVPRGSTATPAQQQTTMQMARELYRQRSVVASLEGAVERAQTHASGVANGIRSEFSTLSKNDRFMRMLNPVERRAVRGMASGRNLRTVGAVAAKMDPFRSNLRMMMILGGGFASGFPGTAVATLAVGRGATLATGKAATKAAERVIRQVAGAPPQQATLGQVLGTAAGIDLARQRPPEEELY